MFNVVSQQFVKYLYLIFISIWSGLGTKCRMSLSDDKLYIFTQRLLYLKGYQIQNF